MNRAVFLLVLTVTLAGGVHSVRAQVYNSGNSTTTISTPATWNQAAYIGSSTSNNTVTINGVTVTQSPGYDLTIGGASGASSNLLTVDGAGGKFSGNSITLGAASGANVNRLIISNGGKVELADTLTLGVSGAGSISATITGTGSQLTTDAIVMVGSLTVGSGGYVKTDTITSSGLGSVTLNTGGTLETGSFNSQAGQTYSAPLQLNGGTLKLTAAGSSVGIINLGSSATPTSAISVVNEADTFTFSNTVTNWGGLNKTGAGTLVLSGDLSTLYGAISVAEGVLRLGNNSSTSYMPSSSGTNTLSTEGEVQFSYNGTTYLNRTLSGSGTLTAYSGTLNLNAANTMTGKLRAMNGATLGIYRREALFNGDTSYWTAAHFMIESGGTLALYVGGTNQLTSADLGTLLDQIRGGTATTGLLGGSRLSVNTGTTAGTVVSVNSNVVDTHEGTAAITLVKEGANTTLDLAGSGVNTYSGGTVINGGWVKASSRPGTGAITGSVYGGAGGFIYGAAFDDLPSFEMTLGAIDTNGFDVSLDSISVPTTFYKMGAGQLTLGPDASVSLGGIYVYSGTLKLLAQNASGYDSTTLQVGASSGGTAAAKLILDGVTFNRGSVSVVSSASYGASLEILNGAQLNTTSGGNIGSQAGGAVTSLLLKGQSSGGAGSKYTMTSFRLGYSGSYNTLTIQDGGQMLSSSTHPSEAVTIGYGSTSNASYGNYNVATVKGAGSQWLLTGAGGFILGKYGSYNELNLEDGAVLKSGTTIVGDNSSSTNAALGSHNSVNITGAGSKWTTGELRFGHYGSYNELNITSGGQMEVNGDLFFGFGLSTDAAQGSNNAISVSGAGSKLSATGLFRVGYYGNSNSLDIDDGAQVTAGSAKIGAGYASGSTVTGNLNSASISGAGSKFTSTGLLAVGEYGSQNTMTVSAGAVVSSATGSVGVGFYSGGAAAFGKSNTATVTGAGSAWNVAGAFKVGDAGNQNALNVENGGYVSSGSVILGGGVTGVAGYGTSNTAKVTGAGSRWDISSTLTVGSLGSSNSVTVEDGGVVNVTGDIVVGAGSTSYTTNGNSNSLIISGAGSSVSTDGSLSIGGVSASYRGTANTVVINDQAIMIVGDSAVDALYIRTGNYLRLDGGYIALFGDRTATMASLYSGGGFQVMDADTGNWVTATLEDTRFQYFDNSAEGKAAAKAYTGGLYDDLGGFTVVATVPEPSTWALLGLGATVLLVFYRRRQSA